PDSPVGNVLLSSNNFSLVVTNGTIKPYEKTTFADNLTYEFQIATDQKFANIVAGSPLVNEDLSGSTSWDASGLVGSGTYFWRARVFDGAAYGPWSITENFKVELPNAPPLIDIDTVIPAVKTPSVYPGNSLAFSVTAHDPENGILTYTWFIDGIETAHTQAFDYMPLTADIGLHDVVVKVSDGLHEVLRTWNVTVRRMDTVPVAPSADRPTGGEDVASLTPQLSVNNSYDAEGDKLDYFFEVSETFDFTAIADTVTVAEGLNITAATVGGKGGLNDNTLYYWRARSCETEYTDMCSSYSAVESFFVNIANDAPGKPGIESPSDGIQVTTLTPALSIIKSLDPDLNNSLTYDIEVASDSGYLDIVNRATGIIPVEGEIYVTWLLDGAPLNDNQVYYWRARAIDNHGLDSGWAAASFFVNLANDAPSVPTLLSPATGMEVEGLNVTLVTNNSSDADMDPLSYVFQIDKANTFKNPLILSSELSEGAGVTSWAVPVGLAENTLYYWRVIVSDGMTMSISDSANFFVNSMNEAPLVPLLKTPLDGEKVLTAEPVLSLYSSSDPDGDSIKYTYQVSDSADFGYIIDISPIMDTTWAVNIPLEENMYYYWRAIAIDEHELRSDWSEPGSFMVNVQNDAPSAPVILNQMFGFTDNIVLEVANSTDPEGDILTYNIQIFSDRNLTSDVESIDKLPEGMKATLWTLKEKIQNGVYYWRARAHDGNTYGSWSGTRELHIDKARGNSNPRTDKAYGRKRF
ncbi:MAG: hypothetical protein OEV42_19760, partial [Deltaproteobacteria bacterium]|nr:hypothetical protein [Deltaproteobacteria bacterium]